MTEFPNLILSVMTMDGRWLKCYDDDIYHASFVFSLISFFPSFSDCIFIFIFIFAIAVLIPFWAKPPSLALIELLFLEKFKGRWWHVSYLPTRPTVFVLLFWNISDSLLSFSSATTVWVLLQPDMSWTDMLLMHSFTWPRVLDIGNDISDICWLIIEFSQFRSKNVCYQSELSSV